jgi:hypothetical protein
LKLGLKLVSLGAVSVILWSLQIACNSREQTANKPAEAQSPAAGQSPVAWESPAARSSGLSENYPNLVTQAQEVNDAFRRRDFARMVDLTYPKVIEAAGGRDKMVSALAKGMREMEAEGVVVLSSTAGAPTQIVHASGSIYAVLPTTLKVKAQDGIFQTESSMIGISSDSGATWTFIDAGGKDQNQLKNLLPDAASKLSLPAEKQPVKISNN